MPGPILHLGAVVTCTHAGPAQPTSPVGRVLVSGSPVVTIATPYQVTGCSLAGTGTPPCASGVWLTGSLRVLVLGLSVAVPLGQSNCLPTGTPMLAGSAQPRVVAA
jgi:hypothetical protein